MPVLSGGGSVELLVACVLLGLMPAVIAYHKGRNIFAWWVYGALLFIVALPHALLLSASSASSPASRHLRPCPFCAELIQREARLCRFCQRSVSSAASMPGLSLKDEARQSLREEQRRLDEARGRR
jgi:hypothetical protein